MTSHTNQMSFSPLSPQVCPVGIPGHIVYDWRDCTDHPLVSSTTVKVWSRKLDREKSLIFVFSAGRVRPEKREILVCVFNKFTWIKEEQQSVCAIDLAFLSGILHSELLIFYEVLMENIVENLRF